MTTYHQPEIVDCGDASAYSQLSLVDCKGVTHVVDSFPAVIGRSGITDVRIVGDPTISRIHARFISRDGKYAVEDLGSMNKTYVQNCQLYPYVPTMLTDGDELRLSDVTFVVRIA